MDLLIAIALLGLIKEIRVSGLEILSLYGQYFWFHFEGCGFVELFVDRYENAKILYLRNIGFNDDSSIDEYRITRDITTNDFVIAYSPLSDFYNPTIDEKVKYYMAVYESK